ncbi:MAG: ABC transporter substrate-binding protein [Anaerolineales bacterium]|nr:ABC transporter substrate-binding protein [Anaerolineales bacterium]
MRRADSATWKPLIFAVFMVWLVGCGGQGSEPQATALPTHTSVPALPFDVQLTLWHPYTDTTLNGLQAITEAFNASQNQIEVVLEYHRAETMLADYELAVRSGGGPDILVGNYQWIAPLADNRLIYPLSAEFRSAAEDSIPAALTSSLEYRRDLWGVPLMGDTLVLYLNDTILTEESDLLAQPTLIDPAGIYALYHGVQLSMVDADGRSTFLRLDLMSYLREYRQIMENDNVRWGDDSADFINGDVQQYIGYASAYPALQAQLGDALTVVTLPSGWRPFVEVVPLLLSANATDTSVEAATRFFAYVLSASGQQVFIDASGWVPPIAGSRSDVEWTMAVMFERSQGVSPYPLYYETILPQLEVYLERARTEDIEQVADEFLEAIR